jgi:hypothetical protein
MGNVISSRKKEKRKKVSLFSPVCLLMPKFTMYLHMLQVAVYMEDGNPVDVNI